MTENDDAAAANALFARYQALCDARLGILDVWNHLENDLVSLMRTASGIQDPALASIIYFSPHSFTTRLDMLTKMIDYIVVGGMLDPALKDEWMQLGGKLRRKKDARNLAAHGNIGTWSDPSGKGDIALMPLFTEVYTSFVTHKKGRSPGLSVEEIQQAITNTAAIAGKIREFEVRLKEGITQASRRNR